jgi:hypothetical protein
VFGCVSWAHISDDCRKKLDAKSHACIMTGYSEESEAYRLIDPIKRQIIIRQNVWFDEKSSGIKLLNVSSGLLQDDPFGVVSDPGSPAPPFNPSSGQSNFVHVSTGSSTSTSSSPSTFVSTSPSTENSLTSNRPIVVTNQPRVSCLPRWVVKAIEVVGVDASDISSGRQTRSRKQHSSFSLMTHVLETSDLVAYSNAQGRPEWEHDMQTEIDSLTKNHTWDLVP